MYKKITKSTKLSLHVETIRQLGDAQLQGVAGATGTGCPTRISGIPVFCIEDRSRTCP